MKRRRQPPGTPSGGRFASENAPAPSNVGLCGDIPRDLLPYLPGDTARAWSLLAPVLPASAYLIGGTALTVHLRHRTSRDLDFALGRQEDIGAARSRLEAIGALAVSFQDDRTLNAVFDGTRIQLLDVSDQTVVAEPSEVGGLRIASVEDIAAMKIKVIGDRGAMRDYYDLMELDRRNVVLVPSAIRLFVLRYKPRNPEVAVQHLVRALGYLADVEPDPALPVSGPEIVSYWEKRQPEVLLPLSRW